MANLKSSVITALDATPIVIQNARLVRADLKVARGTLEVTTSEGAGAILRFVRVPSNALIHRVLLSCDDAGTTGATDVGVYRTSADGGAVVDADFFASAVDLNAAALNHSDVTHEADAADGAAGYGQADIEKPLWQALGLAADPQVLYDIAATITTVSTATFTMNLIVEYVE